MKERAKAMTKISEKRNKHVNIRKHSLKHKRKKGNIKMKEVNINEKPK